MVGNFVDAIIRHLGYDDSLAGCGVDVHIVHADSKARNDAAALHLADHVRVDFCVGDEQRIGFLRRCNDSFRRGLRRQTQLGPGPRNDGAGQVQVWKHRVGYCNQESRH